MLIQKINVLNERERDYIASLYTLFRVGRRPQERIRFLRARFYDGKEADRKGRGIEARALQNLEAVYSG